MSALGSKFFGFVVGTSAQKTIKVRVEKIKMHPIIQKPIRSHKNFLVHDEKEQCVVGDYIRMDKCKKISKRKYYELGEIVHPAQRVVDSSGTLITQRPDVPKEVFHEHNVDKY